MVSLSGWMVTRAYLVIIRGGNVMNTTIDEIADGIYRISTWVDQIAPPAGFSFNQFLIDADEPLLFHTGPRTCSPPSPRRPPRWYHSSGCVGSPSVTWSPTRTGP